MSQSVIYGETFHEQANLFSQARGKPESEISSCITHSVSVISALQKKK